MRRLSTLLFAAAVSAAPALAQGDDPPAVGSAPATTEAILAAVQDCDAAIGPGRVDAQVLISRGWIVGGREEGVSAAGIKIESVRLGKTGGQVINIVQVIGGLSVHCRTVAILSDEAQFSEIRTALIETMQLRPADEFQGDRSDRVILGTMDEDDRKNALLGLTRRITMSRMEGLEVPTVLIANFPKRTD